MQLAVLVLSIVSVTIVLIIFVQGVRITRKAARTEKNIASLKADASIAARQPAYSNNAVRQLEDLQALYHELSPRHALPRTGGWPALPDFLRVIMEQVRERRPNVIVEMGAGASTIVAAYTLEKLAGGKIHSLDHDETYLQATAANVRDHSLGGFVELVYAPLVTIADYQQPWYATDNIPDGPIDMLIIDGPPGATAPLARYPAVPLLFDRLSDSACIILDDSSRADERKCIARWRQAYPELREQSMDCEKGCVVLTRQAE